MGRQSGSAGGSRHWRCSSGLHVVLRDHVALQVTQTIIMLRYDHMPRFLTTKMGLEIAYN